MKKWLFLFTIFLCNSSFALPIQRHQLDPDALLQLATALQLPQNEELVVATQKHWLRKPDQERWEMQELTADQRAYVLRWATEQGLGIPWKPVLKFYDKALIFGATTPRMQKRLDFLKQLWNEGTRFQEIVWLTGARPLDPRVDQLTDLCQTEAEAARILWNTANLPEEMSHLPIVFIDVPMKMEERSLQRPTTQDTLVAWLNFSQHPCTALFISDQPFCGYQFAIINNILPDAFLFDVAGAGSTLTGHPAAAAIILDTLARWIYVTRGLKKDKLYPK